MAKLWYFNPWNDIALASDSVYFTPPPAAKKLAESGSTLPLWFADKNDYVFLDRDGLNFYENLRDKEKFPKPWNGEKVEACCPWGWSKAVRQFFLTIGIEKEILPADSQLDSWRNLSNRRLTIEVHRFLDSEIIPIEAKNVEDCLKSLGIYGEVIGKYPWSSSGRGLFSGSKEYIDSFIRRCQGTINHQGSVMIEKRFTPLKDFAMLFFINEAKEVWFEGFSLFENNKRAYVGNYLLPQKEIFSILCRYVEESVIEQTKNKLLKFISDSIAPYYCGPVGIDMMIYSDIDENKSDRYRLNPCVEVNLRYTMGFVALKLMKNHLPTGFQGLFNISSGNITTETILILNPSHSFFHFTIQSD